MPLGSRRQQHRNRGQAADESAIEISNDEVPEDVAEQAAAADEEMEYAEEGGEGVDDEDDIEGMLPQTLPFS